VATLTDGAGDASQPAAPVPMLQDGWFLFAGLLILFAGLWNIFQGMVGLLRSDLYTGTPAFGAVWGWAIAWLAFGVVAVAAGAAIMSGRSWARWFGIAVASLNALVQLASAGAYPLWSLAMVALDVLVLYALTVHWQRATED